MGRKKIPIDVGREYGWLTVLGEGPKDGHGHIRYHVRCRCGREIYVQSPVLRKETSKCTECAHKYNQSTENANIVGKIFTHWEVLEEVERNACGSRRFRCKCRSCGAISIKTRGQITARKVNRCENCPPEYDFHVKGSSATGILPDGSKFIIDTADIPIVSNRRWHRKDNGYIVSTLKRGNKRYWRLHDFLLNPGDRPNVIVDHINRDKSDCRRSNLRFVTPQQNCMNKSLSKNNKTGYAGVFFDKDIGHYRAKIVLNNRIIRLGYSDNPVECAQMYNVGAELLFREFAGHHNDVPEPSIELRRTVAEKCLPFMADADLATQGCGLFSCPKTGVAI